MSILRASPEAKSTMILAILAEHLRSNLNITGFYALDEERILGALQDAGLWIGPRSMLEELPSFRQIIPYIVVRKGGNIVKYRRTDASSEQRLHGLISIGVGGHVDLSDIVIAGNYVDLPATLERCAERELREEVGITRTVSRKWVGLLIDNSTIVSRVHIGVIGLWDIDGAALESAEDAVADVSLCAIDQLAHGKESLESWSAMLLPYLCHSVNGLRDSQN